MSQWTGGWCRIRNIVELHFRVGGAVIKQANLNFLNFEESTISCSNNFSAGTSTLTGELKGSRLLLTAGKLDTISVTSALNLPDGITGATNKSYIMPRAGSIVSLSGSFIVSVFTTEGDISLHIYRNDTKVFEVLEHITSTGNKAIYGVQNRNIDTFVAGDRIRFFMGFPSFAGSINSIVALCGIQFDT